MVDEVRYTNDVLSARFDLIGKSSIVHIRDADMRVTCFDANGQALGHLEMLHPGWRNHTHSRQMRKTINALIRNGRISGSDPVTGYLEYLNKEVVSEIRGAPDKVSKSATKLAEASRVSGTKVQLIETKSPAVPPARPIPGHIKQPSWRRT
ncbi:hypothetical protein IP84_13945 [beta proteobacterium AAP99]|nr:hypothetical protein IP84_13945 [beta proteobacterium AAP99]